jgi:predicted transcriptional regulator
LASTIIDPRQLRRVRNSLGITQARLAVEAGVSQSLIAKIESGRVDPTYGSIRSISDALNQRAKQQAEGKKARDIMSSPVIFSRTNAKLLDCVSVMKNKGISQIPILDGGKVVGSITETHLLELISEANNPSSLLSRPVGAFMQPSFPIVSADTPIEALVSLFNHVPAVVVSSGDKLLGLISKIDLITAEAGPRT